MTVEEQLRVVADGHLLTSAGISAGIDLALKVVGRYFGEAVARATARQMEYRVSEDKGGGFNNFRAPKSRANTRFAPTAQVGKPT